MQNIKRHYGTIQAKDFPKSEGTLHFLSMLFAHVSQNSYLCNVNTRLSRERGNIEKVWSRY